MLREASSLTFVCVHTAAAVVVVVSESGRTVGEHFRAVVVVAVADALIRSAELNIGRKVDAADHLGEFVAAVVGQGEGRALWACGRSGA